MLRVLHTISSLNLGGAERIAVELAEVQRNENLDAQILSLGTDKDFLVASARKRGIPIFLNNSSMNRIRRYRSLLTIFKSFDVIHIHSRGALRFISPLIPLLRGKRIIYTRHGLQPDSSLEFRILYRFLRPFISYITFVTETGLAVFSENHKWDVNKLAVVRNGVFVSGTLKSKGEFPISFGSVGRMVPLKGQIKLLEAGKLVERHLGSSGSPCFKIKLFGDGPLECDLREMADTMTKGVVEFGGQETDLEKIYDDIDVLIVASESEGLSMAILEAMARGIPTIATNVGGNSTLVHHNSTGLLVDEQSAEQFRDAMLKIIDDTSLIQKYGRAAKLLVESQFSLLETHRTYLKYYIDT